MREQGADLVFPGYESVADMVLQESIKSSLRKGSVSADSPLRIAKYRTSEGLFVAEGEKSIALLRQHYKLRWL